MAGTGSNVQWRKAIVILYIDQNPRNAQQSLDRRDVTIIGSEAQGRPAIAGLLIDENARSPQ